MLHDAERRLTVSAPANSLLAAVLLALLPSAASAQFLRLGVLTADLAWSEELVYSSNIDGVRESEAREDMEDYYLASTLTLTLKADITRELKLSSDIELVNEKHFIRTDLDEHTLSDPFGQLDLDLNFKTGRLELNAYASHEATYEENEGQYAGPAAEERVFHHLTSYGLRLAWQRRQLSWYGYAEASHDRYQEEEFQEDDSDEYSFGTGARWQVNRRISLTYDYEQSQKILINQDDAYDGWDHTQTVGADFLVLKRPNLTYTFALEEESSQGEEIEWQPTHTVTISDSWQLQPSVRASADASYTYKEEKAENDVSFTYGAGVEHQVSRTLRHSLSATREPVDTLGSTADTDSTTVDYSLNKTDLFIYNLVLAFNAGYSHDEPLGDGDVEDTWSWDVSLTHSRRLTRKLNRSLSYEYTWEDSSLENEPLEEHRVTLTFTYTF